MNKLLKKIIIFLIIITITGCKTKSIEEKEKIVEDNDTEKIVEPVVEKTIPTNLGLYTLNNGIRTIVTEYESNFPQYQDLVSFETYFTKDNTLPNNNQKNLWNQYYETYKDIPNLKIGYHIKFTTDEGEVDKTITSPEDVESFFNYIQIYLYDDIHQESGWYSHVTKEDMKEETIFTSIKLTGSTKIDNISSPITLTVFSYQKGEKIFFDDNNSYQITIKRK